MRWRQIYSKIPWAEISQLIGIILGASIVGASINSLILPNHIADGGVTGIAIILHYLFGCPVGITIFLLNLPLFIMGFRMVGRRFLIYSIIGVAVMAFTLDTTSGIVALTHDTLLASIFGGFLTGIGMGLIFRSQGSLGGTDILAVFFNRTTQFSVGQILLGMDAVIFLATALLFTPETAMYAMIYMFIATRVIDLVQEGINHSKSVMIVTGKPEQIAQVIMSKLNRGVTFISGTGAFSGQPKNIVYCVISRAELSQIKDIVRENDPNSFLTISEVPEVVGEGFSSWKGH
ncbi:MAG: YitT family protein [Desulfitobacteriaceae bacterium]|nr:YitT family protein [Desulfitobacteriaceae bacterium]MDD4345765.1 YitT family protein [Desulfitobacteriaceae bacterium]MDD4400970.1 YitT family protein [Desulfitobacteriaceae bacterium]